MKPTLIFPAFTATARRFAFSMIALLAFVSLFNNLSANTPKAFDIKAQKQQTELFVSLENAKQDVYLVIKDKQNRIFYSNFCKNIDCVQQINLTNLPAGEYRLEAESGNEIATYDFSI
ncbi:DUF3244 domain-containing protein [Hugenholtzia roseola]|uniref:DUF3244 domain-containing protein n=1 Tax=Hugenholtzia roseola TaxID=1002 RepID=UPI001378888E|nr:DUF3244 domain-containing protein [Hugenholtzia roseola]